MFSENKDIAGAIGLNIADVQVKMRAVGVDNVNGRTPSSVLTSVFINESLSDREKVMMAFMYGRLYEHREPARA